MDNNRILISRMKFIGDIVLTTPIIQALREKYPNAFIAYLGEREAVTLLNNNPYLDEIIPYDFRVPSVIEQVRVISLIRKKRFDIFIDLFSNPRTAIIALMSGAKIRIGKNVHGRGRFYTHQISDDGKSKTAVEFHYQYLKPLNVEPKYWQTKIFLLENEKKEAKNLLSSYKLNTLRPIIGINPSATWPSKLWPVQRFADLANRLERDFNFQVVFIRDPDKKEIYNTLKNLINPSIKILDVLPLRSLSAVISNFNLFVSNDSGPMHISVAVGTKTVGIFGPGQEEIWFPYRPPYYPEGQSHIALRKDVLCHPCHLNICNRPASEYMRCMNLLEVDEVLQHILKRI